MGEWGRTVRQSQQATVLASHLLHLQNLWVIDLIVIAEPRLVLHQPPEQGVVTGPKAENLRFFSCHGEKPLNKFPHGRNSRIVSPIDKGGTPLLLQLGSSRQQNVRGGGWGRDMCRTMRGRITMESWKVRLEGKSVAAGSEGLEREG